MGGPTTSPELSDAVGRLKPFWFVTSSGLKTSGSVSALNDQMGSPPMTKKQLATVPGVHLGYYINGRCLHNHEQELEALKVRKEKVPANEDPLLGSKS